MPCNTMNYLIRHQSERYIIIVLMIEIILSSEIIAFNYTDSNKVVMANITLMKIMVIKRLYK